MIINDNKYGIAFFAGRYNIKLNSGYRRNIRFEWNLFHKNKRNCGKYVQ